MGSKNRRPQLEIALARISGNAIFDAANRGRCRARLALFPHRTIPHIVLRAVALSPKPLPLSVFVPLLSRMYTSPLAHDRARATAASLRVLRLGQSRPSAVAETQTVVQSQTSPSENPASIYQLVPDPTLFLH